MADPILHIKDAFFFEVPKVLAPAAYQSKRDFPTVWVRLDPQFQDWEFDKLYSELSTLNAGLPPKAEAHEDWQHWVHGDHAHHAKPFDRFLNEKFSAARAEFAAWQRAEIEAARAQKDEAAVEAARKTTFAEYIESHRAGGPGGSDAIVGLLGQWGYAHFYVLEANASRWRNRLAKLAHRLIRGWRLSVRAVARPEDRRHSLVIASVRPPCGY